jgi:hypothetical protein
MRIEFKDYTDVSEVLKYNTGFKPIYGKGTMKGAVWCSCNCCTGNLLYFKERNKVVGFFDTECSACRKQINYSEAGKYL